MEFIQSQIVNLISKNNKPARSKCYTEDGGLQKTNNNRVKIEVKTTHELYVKSHTSKGKEIFLLTSQTVPIEEHHMATADKN